VEVHLLDCQQQLLGVSLRVEPLAWIRSQQRFQDVQALSEQIGRDAQLARQTCQAQADLEQADLEQADLEQAN
jgi:riboflavin kinase/FMN adenylyltransferase